MERSPREVGTREAMWGVGCQVEVGVKIVEGTQ